MKPIGDVHEVVIAIHEADATTFHRMPSPPKAPTAPSQDPTAPSLRLQAPTPPLAHGPITPISLTVPCPSPPPPSQGPPASPTSRESSPRSHTSSPTLVRKGSTVSTGTYSPIMRSMFPRYNPTVPLAQQRYYPQIHINPTAAKTAAEAADSGSYSPSLYAQQEPSRNGQKTPLPKGLGLFDAGKLAEESRDLLDLSTPDELVDLWALANGQTSQKATKEYGLELSWYVYNRLRLSQ